MKRHNNDTFFFYNPKMLKADSHGCIPAFKTNLHVSLLLYFLLFSQQNGAISVPDTVDDSVDGSDGTPSDDVESAKPIENNSGAVKFGWIRGVLVSYVGS